MRREGRSIGRAMTKMLLTIVVVIVGLAGVKYYQITQAMAAHAHNGPPPQAVTSTVAAEQLWHPTIEVVGTLAPSQGVIISAEEEGNVETIGFESGAHVKTGDLLVKINSSVEEAQLLSAQARLDLARINLKRVQGLYTQSAMSESAFNNAVSEAKAAEGDVRAIEATIAKKRITAPFEGRAGIRMVNIGQYLQKGAQIVPLHQLNPMFLDFAVPQQDLASIAVGQNIEFTVDVFPTETFLGKVTAIDTQIDEQTRNVKIQATVDNSSDKLRSGFFAKVKILVGAERKVIALPVTSINYAPYGNSVYVVEKMKDPQGNEYEGVRQQFVQLGQTRGDLIELTSGVTPGQQIVSSGLFKLRPGFPVIINNSVKPGENPAPSPEDT